MKVEQDDAVVLLSHVSAMLADIVRVKRLGDWCEVSKEVIWKRGGIIWMLRGKGVFSVLGSVIEIGEEIRQSWKDKELWTEARLSRMRIHSVS
jgi:hypothetical protein